MKKIIGFENYMVDENGSVLNSKTGRILKPQKGLKGYLMVGLSFEGKSHTRLVHRIVFNNYNGILLKGQEIDHIDGNKLNNNFSNLRQITKIENIQNAVRTGNIPSGFNNKYSKPVKQIDPITKKVIEIHGSLWLASRAIGKKSPALISFAANGKRKSAYGFLWSF